MTRSGGRERDLLVNISVQYDDSYNHREEGKLCAESLAQHYNITAFKSG